MIKASEYLAKIVLNSDDSARFDKTLKEIEEAAEKHNSSLTGFFIEVPSDRINDNVGRALQIALRKDEWHVEIVQLPSKFNERLPGAWRVLVMPNEKTLDAAQLNLTTNQLKLC